MGKAQLEKHGSCLSIPNGISMCQMIDQGVIYRVVRYENGRYVIIGDNCWQLEYVKPDQKRLVKR